MGSRFRFFGAGVAVTALCFLLASMSWPCVLGLFVIASVSWAFWSWRLESNKGSTKAEPLKAIRSPKQSAARTRKRGDNVYVFPPAGHESKRKRRSMLD